VSDSTVDPIRALRVAVRTGDERAVAEALAARPLDDAPQLLADELMVALARGIPGLEAPITRLIETLRERDETGDAELADDLAGRIGIGPVPLLRPLPVDIEELASILEGDPTMSGGRIDRETGDVIPSFGELLDDLDDVEDADDTGDEDHWIHVWSEGSRDGYRDMVRFAATIDDPALEERLDRALHGRGAFRRFKDELSRVPDELTRFLRFTDDRQRGRARAWLADKGYRPVPRRDR
jgi:hypothetical protein